MNSVSDPVGTWLAVATDSDVVLVRQAVRSAAVEAGLGIVDQTKTVTAASELARNVLIHGGGGEARVTIVEKDQRRGVCMEFVDRGPGIPDVDRALVDGYSSAGGMGMGLGGSRRLVDEFTIDTAPSAGTRVVAVKWSR